MNQGFDKLRIQLKKIIKDNLISETNVGHLIPLKCGHRGKPNASEERLLEYLLRHSDFMEPIKQTENLKHSKDKREVDTTH